MTCLKLPFQTSARFTILENSKADRLSLWSCSVPNVPWTALRVLDKK